ncbi:MAG: hypothetical protein IK152_08645 [Lachnospiraceae bacterium]|nr:hypothetical protein [Lachnospiraceae bacterium]
MKKNNTYLFIIGALIIAIGASVASAFITMAKMPPKGSIPIYYDGKQSYFDPAKASTIDVAGVTMTTKGETKDVSAKGYLLKDVFSLSGIKASDYKSIGATASDSAFATLYPDEVDDPGKVYLIEDTSDKGDKILSLVVFGDKDSKRQLKDIIRIDLAK